jgi:hypothetical protein
MWMLLAGDVAGAEGLHAGHVHDGGERAVGAAWPSHTTRLAGARSRPTSTMATTPRRLALATNQSASRSTVSPTNCMARICVLCSATQGSTLGERVFGNALAGRRADFIGNPDLPHTYSYVPDIAAGLATLGTDARAEGKVWHLPGRRPSPPGR